MNNMQQKFQITAKPVKEKDAQWADFRDQRVTHETRDTREPVPFPEGGAPTHMQMSHNNELPTGQYTADEHGNTQSFVAINPASSTDVNDYVTSKALGQGYTKMPMSPVEDMYTDEHRDDFYDDVGGFVERANYLDRL